MNKEIERKWLISRQNAQQWAFLVSVSSSEIEQFYLDGFRVRINKTKNQAFLTIKLNGAGASCDEFEYRIPVKDAEELSKHAQSVIKKTRYIIPGPNDLVWELDVFHEHKGPDDLCIVEVELPNEHFYVDVPNFFGEEVTGKKEYYNKYLALPRP